MVLRPRRTSPHLPMVVHAPEELGGRERGTYVLVQVIYDEVERKVFNIYIWSAVGEAAGNIRCCAQDVSRDKKSARLWRYTNSYKGLSATLT